MISNSRTLDQSDYEMTRMSRSEGQIILQPQEDFEVTKAVSIPRDEKIDKSAKISIEAILIFHQYANLYNSMDDWWYDHWIHVLDIMHSFRNRLIFIT